MVLVVALPPLFYAISWGMLGNPTIGMINTVWRSLTGLQDALFNANSWEGLILVVALKNTAFIYLLVIGPFRALDRSLEEAAQVSGAGRLRTVIGIDLAVLAPAITGVTILSLVISLEAFDVPLFLGTRVGIDVFSTQIYGYIADRSPADYGAASALSMLLIVVVIGLVFAQWKILGSRRYTTVTGKSYRTEPWHIGPWRWVGTAFIVLYLMVAIVLPLIQLVLGSLQPVFGAGGDLTLINYQNLLKNPQIASALRSTFLVASIGGFVAMVLAMTIVYAVTHNESRLRRLLDMLTWLPYTVPGVVLALGLAWTYVSIPGLRQLVRVTAAGGAGARGRGDTYRDPIGATRVRSDQSRTRGSRQGERGGRLAGHRRHRAAADHAELPCRLVRRGDRRLGQSRDSDPPVVEPHADGSAPGLSALHTGPDRAGSRALRLHARRAGRRLPRDRLHRLDREAPDHAQPTTRSSCGASRRPR